MKNANGNSKVTIKIPRALYETINEIVEKSGFDSATDFIVYVLRDIVSSQKEEKKETLSSKEVEMVKNRLKDLGYI